MGYLASLSIVVLFLKQEENAVLSFCCRGCWNELGNRGAADLGTDWCTEFSSVGWYQVLYLKALYMFFSFVPLPRMILLSQGGHTHIRNELCSHTWVNNRSNTPFALFIFPFLLWRLFYEAILIGFVGFHFSVSRPDLEPPISSSQAVWHLH